MHPRVQRRDTGRRPIGRAAVTITAALTLGGAVHAGPAETVVSGMLGCHEFSGGPQQRQRVETAIDEVVDEFTFLVRPIVRSRLEKANPIPTRVCFERQGAELTISLDARKYRAPLNGKAVRVRGITGDELAMRLQVRDGTIIQTFQGEDGGRVNAFRPTTTSGVDMRVRVFSDRLPRSLVYALTYRRASAR